MNLRCFALAWMLTPACLSGPAEARLFEYTHGSDCYVDQYRYWGCPYAYSCRRLPRVDPSRYQGYSLPRSLYTGQYGIYEPCCRPLTTVSAGYAFCDNVWSGHAHGIKQGHQRGRKRWCGHLVPGCLGHGPLPAQPPMVTGHAVTASHLYGMLFAVPCGGCGGSGCAPGCSTAVGGFPGSAGAKFVPGHPYPQAITSWPQVELGSAKIRPLSVLADDDLSGYRDPGVDLNSPLPEPIDRGALELE